MEQKTIRWTATVAMTVFAAIHLPEEANAEESEERSSFFAKLLNGVKELWKSEPTFVISISTLYLFTLFLLFLLIYFKILRNCLKKKDSDTQLSKSNENEHSKPKQKPQTDEKTRYVVLVNGVYYNIRNAIILKGISLSISRGEIYGLLGPSGCGKTTLLRLIVGLKQPKRGNVVVFGTKPGSSDSKVPGPAVGYMPQETALYRELTIKETIEYFGQIYDLSKEKRKERLKILLKVLDLPDENRFVDDLSDGEKRRISLAVALINSPPLLILDEPTVGVDPLLRRTIWNHLIELTKNERTTVIITTHYIEEAKQAHKIALMRAGRLLTESKPNELLSQLNVNTLETAFLRICEIDKQSDESIKKKELQPVTKAVESVDKDELALLTPSKNTFYEHCNIIGALSRKSFLRIKRNIVELIFQMVMPSLQLILFLICVGSEPRNINIAVYNPDTNYSLKFLAQIDRNIFNLKEFDSFDGALNEVKSGKAWVAIVFDANYTYYVMQRFSFPKVDITNETLDRSKIKVYIDMTEYPIQVTIIQSISIATVKYSSDLIAQIPYQLNKETLTASFYEIVDPPVYGSLKPSFRDFVTPGLIISLTFMLSVSLSALSFVSERRSGLLERTLIAGVQTYHIIIAHFLVQITVIMIRTGIVFFSVFVIFNVNLEGSLFLSLFLASLQGMSGMSFGFLISALCREEQMAVLVSVTSFYPSLLLSGIIWPLEGMPVILKYISSILPLTLPIRALRAMMTRGWGLGHLDIWLGYIVTFVWIFIFNILAVFVLKVNK